MQSVNFSGGPKFKPDDIKNIIKKGPKNVEFDSTANKNFKVGGLKNVIDQQAANVAKAKEDAGDMPVQKDFGDTALLVRRVSDYELKNTPEAEIVD